MTGDTRIPAPHTCCPLCGAVLLLAGGDYRNERPAFRAQLKAARRKLARGLGWPTTRGRGARAGTLTTMVGEQALTIDVGAVLRSDLRAVRLWLDHLDVLRVSTAKALREQLAVEGFAVAQPAVDRLCAVVENSPREPVSLLAGLRGVAPASLKRAMARGRALRRTYIVRHDVTAIPTI